jgi:hypothetical protein
LKNYLAVFIGSPSGKKSKKWDALDKKTRTAREQAGMKAWGEWVQKHQKSVVDTGSPLGDTKQIDESGISKTKNQLCAYTIVRAKSHAEAAKLFIDHPHFSIFPGDSVEVMECLPIPGM